jgi:hypothetical protein
VCPFKKTAGKLQEVWNAQNRRTVAANQIKEAVGNKLKTPGAACWTSYYDACVMMLEVLGDPDSREKLNIVMRGQNLPTFCDTDQALLTQYCKIMKPVARCLNSLQGEEDKAYMGILLPNLQLMKDQVEALKTDSSIVEGQELISYLLEHPTKRDRAFKGRFQALFENENLLKATALHPHFKLGIVGYLNMEKKEGIRQAIVSEAVKMVTLAEEIGAGDTQQDVKDDPYMYMRDDQCPLDEDLKKTYDMWSKFRCSHNSSITSDQFPLHNRAAWVDLFSKYNTPLLSSAAASEER